MPSEIKWTLVAHKQYEALASKAQLTEASRKKKGKKKSSKDEGLFKQVTKTIRFLRENPRHPGLNTHPYESIEHPFDKSQKVYVAYAQNKTHGAYRVFWYYGPEKNQVTISSITPHP